MQVDMFSQQDLSAYVSVAGHCVEEAVQMLVEQLNQDPTRANTRTTGFLDLW
jgi:hypothetical protein